MEVNVWDKVLYLRNKVSKAFSLWRHYMKEKVFFTWRLMLSCVVHYIYIHGSKFKKGWMTWPCLWEIVNLGSRRFAESRMQSVSATSRSSLPRGWGSSVLRTWIGTPECTGSPVKKNQPSSYKSCAKRDYCLNTISVYKFQNIKFLKFVWYQMKQK